MSANDTTEPKPNDRSDVPAGYRRVENYNLVEQWEHVETGLSVELYRYARPTQMHDARTSTIDHYEYRLVVRPDGPGSEGECVDRTTERDPDAMAREWLRAHPNGRVDE